MVEFGLGDRGALAFPHNFACCFCQVTGLVNETAVAEQPGDRPLDLPAVSAEPLAGLDTRARDARDESSGAEPGKVFGGVVRLVGADRDRSPSSWPAPGAYGGKAQEQRLERLAVMHVRTGHCDGQRDALRFGQHMQLAALLTAIDRVRPGQRAPLFARTDAASMIAEVQSSAPLAPSSSRTARCSRRHRPALVHAANRRCAVAGEVPNVGGRYRQAQPLVSTYTTAVNTFRSATGTVPPPCCLGRNGGISGAAIFHNPSGTKSRARSTAIADDHAPRGACGPPSGQCGNSSWRSSPTTSNLHK